MLLWFVLFSSNILRNPFTFNKTVCGITNIHLDHAINYFQLKQKVDISVVAAKSVVLNGRYNEV